jgi:hypothetical protein
VSRHLENLCLTCPRLKDIVQPTLFRSLPIHHQEPDDDALTYIHAMLARKSSLPMSVKNLPLDSEFSGRNGFKEDTSWPTQLPNIILPLFSLLVNATNLHFKCHIFTPAKDPSHLKKLISTMPFAAARKSIHQRRRWYGGCRAYRKSCNFLPKD